jgi:TPR repeat protein
MDSPIRTGISAALAAALLFVVQPHGATAAEPALHDCDRLVKAPGDYDRPELTEASPLSMTRPEAVAACRSAVAEDPENPRYLLQLAFALLYPTALYFPDRKEEPPKEAWTWLSRAADAEYPGAMFLMAQMVERGYFPGADNPAVAWRMAFSLYRKAAERGNPAAMLRLASEYSSFGFGFLRGGKTGEPRAEIVQAMDWAKKAVAAGHPRAEIVFAQIVLEGNPVTPEERDAAMAVLTRRMEAGDCDAFWAMGSHLLKRGDPQPQGGAQTANPEALRLLRIAADGGHFTARRMMAGFYGPEGVFKPDPAQAEAWMKKAREAQASGHASGKGCKA